MKGVTAIVELSAVSMEDLIPVIRTQLENGGRAPLVVTGISMHPTLRHCRDLVELVPMDRAPARGDLILYQRDNGVYVLHRIVTKPENGRFICSGDNQWEPEDVREDQIIALVDTYIRDGKHISVNNPLCKLWVWYWIGVFPVRKPLLKMRRVAGRLKKKLGKQQNVLRGGS